MSEIIPYNRRLKPFAIKLRNNMTMAEKLLWSHIKGRRILGLQFCRQLPIESYILDFYCKPVNLAIEIDGPVHFTPEEISKDKNRDYVLNKYEISVLRFTNDQVLDELQKVINSIKDNCLQSAVYLSRKN